MADLKEIEQIVSEAEKLPAGPERDAIISEAMALLDQPTQETPLWKQALTGAGKALDYVGGVSRAALANRPEVLLAEALSSDKPIDAKEQAMRGAEELKQALMANPKSSSELMESRGVGEMGSVNLPLLGKTTGRGTVGFLADVATDPLSYVGAGQLGKQVSKGGKKLYQRAFKNVDLALEKMGKGKNAFSNTLLRAGAPTGSMEDIAAFSDDLAEKLLNQKNQVLANVDATGKNVDLLSALEKYSDDLGKTIRGTNENAAQTALLAKNNLDSQIERLRYHKAQGVPLLASEADAIKTSLYADLPESAFNTLTRTKAGQKITKDIARITKETIEEAAPEIKDINEPLGILLSGKKGMGKEVGKETTRNAVTSVDGALAWLDPQAALAKKAADISKSGWFNTTAGKLLMSGAGGSPGLLINQSLVRKTKEQEEK